MPSPPLAGVVLAGGRSRRMGTDKALVAVGGRPLVARVAARLASVADPVILAPGTPGRLGDLGLGLAEVPDALSDAGPLAGLVAGLRASPHELTAVAAVDLPFVSATLFALLAGLRADEDAVVPVDGEGRLQPVHAVYARAALPALEAALAAGQRRLTDAVAALRLRLVGPDEWEAVEPGGACFRNLNVPADLEGLPGA